MEKVYPGQQRNYADWSTFFTKGGRIIRFLRPQAQTRWGIVGDGAKSLQTQGIFNKLVKDTVAQNDDKVLITNMRTAVKATNVVLNLPILPKLILVPSDLLFLKEKIPGYNNTLTLATKTMKFGENEGLNFDATTTITSTTSETQPSVPSVPSIVSKVVQSASEVNKVNKELGVVFTVLAVVGAAGAWLW